MLLEGLLCIVFACLAVVNLGAAIVLNKKYNRNTNNTTKQRG